MTLQILNFKMARPTSENLSNISDKAAPFVPPGVSPEEYAATLRRRKALGMESKSISRSSSNKIQKILNLFEPTGYGLLYNYEAYNHPEFAIPGTKVPGINEFLSLVNFIGAENAAFFLKGLRSSGQHPRWSPPNQASAKQMLFNAYGAGYRDKDGSDTDFGLVAKFGSTTKDDFNNDVVMLTMQNNSVLADVNITPIPMNDTRNMGVSIRLVIEDDSPLFNQYYEGMYITDPNGNKYGLVKIGKQIWTCSNYMSTVFHNENVIPLILDDTDWTEATGPGYCFPNADINLVGRSSQL